MINTQHPRTLLFLIWSNCAGVYFAPCSRWRWYFLAWSDGRRIFPLAGAPAADEFAEGWQDDCDRCDWLVLRSGQSHAAAGAGDCAAICAVPTVGLCRAGLVPA